MILLLCNQFPMIAMRYNDVVKGTHVSKFKAAWDERGMVSKRSGLFKLLWMVKQEQSVDVEEVPNSAWTMGFMPWNYDAVKSMHQAVISARLRWQQQLDGLLRLREPIRTRSPP
ncbi:hypothetical protein FJTKL_06952 [Diaporthe vaccinii]|uniref:Linalool dehydratase/isomerase domain-containing protein n=1 Tax=Diaporthe vaccinii TaxID=105482 RepID=A0ABR4DPV2_9PEZI